MVTMSAKGMKEGNFDTVAAKYMDAVGLTISLLNGDPVVGIGAGSKSGYIYL